MMKLFAFFVVLTSLGVGAAIVIGGRGPKADTRPATPLLVASPADSFVVHDAPTAAPSPDPAPGPAAPAPADSTLDATIERLRAAAAAKPDAPPPANLTITAPFPQTDPLLSGPAPAPSILAGPPAPSPPPSWTAVTSQGVRWRGARDSNGPTLVIDMGAGRAATVEVDPAFQALAPAAASARVDFLKETILENFPPGSNRFRFAGMVRWPYSVKSPCMFRLVMFLPYRGHISECMLLR